MVGLLSKLMEMDPRLMLPTMQLCEQVQWRQDGLATSSSLIPLSFRSIAEPTRDVSAGSYKTQTTLTRDGHGRPVFKSMSVHVFYTSRIRPFVSVFFSI